jgi:hypothetical protein
MNWYPEACPVCRGDLHDDIEDEGWVTCFSCARSFAPGDPRVAEILRLDEAAKDSPAPVVATHAA